MAILPLTNRENHEQNKFKESTSVLGQVGVVIVNPDGSTVGGGSGGGAATIADGSDVTEGAIADVIVAAGATGTVSAKLRRISQGLEDLKTLIILAAGSNVIGGVTQSGTWTVTANPTTPTTVQYGRSVIVLTGTAVQLASKAVSGVIVQAFSTNAASIYVGDVSVTSSNGFELQAGQATSVAIDNTNRLYINGTAGDSVRYIGS